MTLDKNRFLKLGHFGPRLQLLDEGWAFDLFKEERVISNGAWETTYKVAPWNCSWWHKCLNSNTYSRTDYIKNLSKYGKGYPDYPVVGCRHCRAPMPKRYEMFFRAVFMNERLKYSKDRENRV